VSADTAGAKRLSTREVARFVARGYLEFPALTPDGINQQYLDEMGGGKIPEVAAGTPLSHAYPKGSALARLYAYPPLAAIIESLVGPDPLVDHHFVHLTLGEEQRTGFGFADPLPSQHWHQDSTIDTRQAFDVQIMWYPHEVTADMGGTRFLPGSHLRVVSEAAVGRYQNIKGQRHVVCPAGTALVLHHGVWHGGGSNTGPSMRHMVKIRLQARVPQVRLWDDSDLTDRDFEQQPIFWALAPRAADDLHSILCENQPWYEADTHRLEFVNRIRLFRYLLGDDAFDADYWCTRLEHGAGRRNEAASGTREL
jgi:hypothetical protein